MFIYANQVIGDVSFGKLITIGMSVAACILLCVLIVQYIIRLGLSKNKKPRLYKNSI